MKKFFRSFSGKVIAFTACVLMLAVSAAALLGCAFLLDDPYDIGFYSGTESEGTTSFVEWEVRDVAYLLMEDVVDDTITHSNIKDLCDFEVSDLYELLYFSGDKKEFPYEYYFSVNKGSYEIVNAPSDTFGTVYCVRISPKPGTPLMNRINFFTKLIHWGFVFRFWIFVIAGCAVLLTIVLFIVLMRVSARCPDSDDLKPGLLHRVPYDLLLLLAFFVVGITALITDEFVHAWNDVTLIAVLAAEGLVGTCMFLGLSMSFAARVKDKSLLKNTMLYRFCLLLGRVGKAIGGVLYRFFQMVPLIWKTLLLIMTVCLFELLVFAAGDWSDEIGTVLLICEKILFIPLILYFAVCLRKLKQGGEKLAHGELDYITDTKGMVWDLKDHGEHLNSIADGMAVAVENRTKSERMKTELITNVSHDLKTPLTSIINYANLIHEEHCENKTIDEYSEVLVRQSERLKRLIEDLVEVSKASTGNLDVQLAPCDASVFITQAAGEFEERLNEKKLSLVTKEPLTEVRIMADGRRMWRVFDNLLTNICKYSLEGTRVYITLQRLGTDAVFVFKNTSKDPLDLTEEELMERFVRGDASRNTEGNGLGLSIAKSMVELQNGQMNIQTDGDLFKVIVSFPCL